VHSAAQKVLVMMTFGNLLLAKGNGPRVEVHSVTLTGPLVSDTDFLPASVHDPLCSHSSHAEYL
jgi:hypothetical protein